MSLRYLVGLIVLWMGPLSGQNAGLKFRSYGIKEGLSQSTITDIYQDKKGFLWFATSDGLNQFDGYKFNVYKNNYLNIHSLSDSWVEHIFEDSDNNLWLLTADRIINVLSLRTQNITRFIPGKAELLNFPPFDLIFAIREDSHKNVWLSTNAGLLKYNNPSKKFTFYHNNHVLPANPKENFILFIEEDPKGFMWFVAVNGLYRFNSNTDSFEAYSVAHGGIKPNNIVRFGKDKSQHLWALNSIGLYLYQPTTNSFITYPFPGKVNFKLKDDATPTKIDRNGFVWIGTETGLYRFDPKLGHYYFYQSKPGVKGTLSNSFITSIFEDRSGNLWIGTFKGLNKYIPACDNFESYYFKDQESIIANIIEDKNGDILTLGREPYQHSRGGYLGILNKETNRLEIQLKDKCNPNSIASSIVYHPFTDKSGNIWLGTFGDGVVQYIPHRKMFEHYPPLSGNPNTLGGNSVWGFAEDNDGNIWIPLYDNGLDKFNPKTKEFVHFKPGKSNSLPNNCIVFSIAPGQKEDLWITSEGNGIFRFNSKTQKFKQYTANENNPNSISSNFVRKIRIDASGKLWMGHSVSGLDYFDPVTETAIHFKNDPNNKNSLANNNVWSLLLASSGDLWISCDGFIDRYNPVTKVFTHYKSKSTGSTGILANRALCIFEDKHNNIWFGTSGGGLSLFDNKTNKFHHWTETEGLPNNVIYGILEDEQNYLWLSTNKGLSRFNVKQNTFTNYDENDGLQSNEFNMCACYKSRDNKLYFGGINGFNSFYSGKIKTDTTALNTVINSFEIFNKEIQVVPSSREKLIDKNDSTLIIRDNKTLYLPMDISYTKEITLTFREKVFSFCYAALCFKSQDQINYRFIMENFDQDWNYAGKRRCATYTNLPDGEYIFKVSAANADGVWNPIPTSIKVRILPPFWRTWWFFLFEGLFIFGLIMLVMRFRVMRLKKSKIELEKNVEERTHEIKEKNEELELRNLQIIKQKEEIAFQAQQLKTELTAQNQTSELALLRSQINPHFLFNTLNNIYSLVYQKSESGPEAVMKLSEIMRYMLYEATSEKVLLQNEINYLKSFIELQLLRIKNREFVSFNINGNVERRTISPMLLIAFVENAFKHGVKRGVNPGIIINLDVSDNKITFEVINYCRRNGELNKDLTGGIGLANIKRRLELLHPNKFKLDILNNEDLYHVKLHIDE
jgi:ligand-binding sensor domain-containing protein/sensor histidine kinase YesM